MFLRAIFFSDLKERKVEDEKSRRIGVIKDIVVSFAEEVPRVIGVCIDREGYFPISLFGGLSADRFRLMKTSAKEPFREREWRVGKLLLDRQVIDRVGKRVYRVNDLVFAVYGRGEQEKEAFFVGTDVGIRGFFRRMGAEWIVAQKQSQVIGWRSLAMISQEMIPSCMVLERLEEISANDVTEICRKLGRYDRRVFLRQLPDMLSACGEIRYEKPQCRDGQLPVFRAKEYGQEADGEGGVSCLMQYDEDGG